MGEVCECLYLKMNIYFFLLIPVLNTVLINERKSKMFNKNQIKLNKIINILTKENFILEDIHDISQLNYSGTSDWAYLSALYPVLTLKVQEQVLVFLQNVEFSSDYFILAKIYHDYDIPIFNVEVFERYKSMIVWREVYYSNLLLKVRKDKRCSSFNDKIDSF